MVNCPKCKTPNSDGANFCKACRTPLPKSSEKQRRCPNGHIMDPSWAVCPQCQGSLKAGTPVRTPTFVEPDGAAPMAGGSGNSPRRPTVPIGLRIDEQKGKKTVVEPLSRQATGVLRGGVNDMLTEGKSVEDKKEANVSPSGKTRRLVGFLVTYSHDSMGQAFEIREGRHIIGRTNGDICLPSDTMMSSEHAVLLYRRGKFHFEDKLSTNGSFINGEEVSGQIELHNYDRIKMGDTAFTLVVTEPQNEE